MNCLLCFAPGALLCDAHQVSDAEEINLGAQALKGEINAAKKITDPGVLAALATAFPRLSWIVKTELLNNPHSPDSVGYAGVQADLLYNTALRDWGAGVYEAIIQALPEETGCECGSDACEDCRSDYERYSVWIELIGNRSVPVRVLKNHPVELTTAVKARTVLVPVRYLADPVTAHSQALNPLIAESAEHFDYLLGTYASAVAVKTVQLTYAKV